MYVMYSVVEFMTKFPYAVTGEGRKCEMVERETGIMLANTSDKKKRLDSCDKVCLLCKTSLPPVG